ncbi:MAG: pyrroline-5-carboxylate reductase [Sphaerochaetaceae bacterium]|nr:pyrroline-5-carboxylate reductase [Sphaerochaetaceae bacterium]
MTNIGIIGCGNMGGAIATALVKREEFKVTVYDSYRPTLDAFISEHDNANAAPSISELIEQNDYILIAVKPQILSSLYAELSKAKGKNIISIAAGVPIAVLDSNIPSDNIARFMPNIAAKVSKAVTAVCFKKTSSEEFKKTAFAVASAIGSVFILEEDLISAFIGISGSAIAFVFEFIHALAMGGTEVGIPYQQSVEIARDTLLSACALQASTKKNPVELMSQVCSAKGTTIMGMDALYQGGFDGTVVNAVTSCYRKSVELEKAALESIRKN